MKVIAVYNMKGGVGKTTAAVNLAYLASAGGQRVLLWDLDPQAASSFALRVKPQVEGFNRKSLERAGELAAAIKETDYANLDLLPADFAYRKLDRLLHDLGKPHRVVRQLLETLGRDYDAVVLDCPAGFSLLIEGIFAAAGVVLVPTIPTVLSLRTMTRLIQRAQRAESSADLVAFLSMVDRRKLLHRRACEWSRHHPEIFLNEQVPYASIVEQMAVRRMPLNAFAPRDPAAMAFAEIWAQVRSRLQQPMATEPAARDPWASRLRAIETLMARLEAADDPGAAVESAAAPEALRRTSETAVIDFGERRRAHRRGVPEDGPVPGDAYVVHRFDTEHRDLERRGYVLELHERKGSLIVAVTRLGGDDGATVTARAQAQVDGSWAFEILSGSMSPLTALERRLGRPGPAVLEGAREIAGRGPLRRIESRPPAPAGDGPVTPRSTLAAAAGGELADRDRPGRADGRP